MIVPVVFCLLLFVPLFFSASRTDSGALVGELRLLLVLRAVITYPGLRLSVAVFGITLVDRTIGSSKAGERKPNNDAAKKRAKRPKKSTGKWIAAVLFRRRTTVVRTLARLRFIGTVASEGSIVFGGLDDPAAAAEAFGWFRAVRPFLPGSIAITCSVDYGDGRTRWSGKVAAMIVPALLIVYLLSVGATAAVIVGGEWLVRLRRAGPSSRRPSLPE